MFTNLLKSVLHNVGVVIVGLGVAWVGTMIDALLGSSGSAAPVIVPTPSGVRTRLPETTGRRVP